MRAERPVQRIVPATLAFDASGNPFSPQFGDVYHSADSAEGQARHVFLHGNDLPARWAGERSFTIVETGFGPGLNFLATWQAWREDPHRCARLHFVSIERWPFVRADLSTLHARHVEFAPLSSQLRAAWPPLVPGLHRLHFDDERVSLTLAFDEAIEAVHGLRLAADAFYLDGFAPDRNPAMWSPQLLKALARLAAPGATTATYSAAGVVRDSLIAAGFTVEKRSGFGRKREMLAGRLCAALAGAAAPCEDAVAGTPRDRDRRRTVRRRDRLAPRRARLARRPRRGRKGAVRRGIGRCARAYSNRTFRATTTCSPASPVPDSCTPCGYGPVRSTLPRRRPGSVAGCCSWPTAPTTRHAWPTPPLR